MPIGLIEDWGNTHCCSEFRFLKIILKMIKSINIFKILTGCLSSAEMVLLKDYFGKPLFAKFRISYCK